VKKWMVALFTGALMAVLSMVPSGVARADDMLNYLIISASADSWNTFNAQTSVRDDPGVQAGKAMRISARKGVNAWDAQASITINKQIHKGDVILVVYYARVETPPAGATTAIIPNAGIGLNAAPYTSFAGEAAYPTNRWAVYYTSGVADADYAPGALNFSVQLAAETQTLDLGPVFIFNFGPNYDRSKLPHNRTVMAAAPAPAAPPTAETIYTADLNRLRTRLPVRGTLLNDPGAVFGFGSGLTTQQIVVPEISGGKAVRTVMAHPAAQAWDAGASSPITGTIHKGDVILVAAYVRVTEASPGSQAGLIAELGVHMSQSPWTAVATASASVPKGQWTWVYASGVATVDYPAGSVGFGMQLGCCQQTLDIGPVFVLNLGPGVNTAALPNNFGRQ
jgi:hypothetical protein